MDNMPVEAPDLKIAGLSLWVSSREFPDQGDYWDGNWLTILARVVAQGSFVEVRGPVLRTDELVAFASQLEIVNRDLSGEAELTCTEPNLNVKVSSQSLGHLEVVISITPDHMMQSHAFTFEIDQSYLGSVLQNCKRILKRFPVLGSPG